MSLGTAVEWLFPALSYRCSVPFSQGSLGLPVCAQGVEVNPSETWGAIGVVPVPLPDVLRGPKKHHCCVSPCGGRAGEGWVSLSTPGALCLSEGEVSPLQVTPLPVLECENCTWQQILFSLFPLPWLKTVFINYNSVFSVNTPKQYSL